MRRNKNERKCCGCQSYKDKSELIRIVKLHDTNEIVVSDSTKLMGYSVYLCKNKECLNSAIKKKRIERLLKKNLTKTELEQIKSVLENIIVLNI